MKDKDTLLFNNIITRNLVLTKRAWSWHVASKLFIQRKFCFIIVFIWIFRGVGCIYTEMISGMATFPGMKDAYDQLDRIWRVSNGPKTVNLDSKNSGY